MRHTHHARAHSPANNLYIMLAALAAGLVFGIGLIISGMTNPEIVQGFFDISANWNPSLPIVMGSALPVSAIAFYLARKKSPQAREAGHSQAPNTFFGDPIHLPGTSAISRRLVIGSALFGAGWGLAGICPGPSLVLLGSASQQGLIFFAAMLAGMFVASRVFKS